MSERPHLSVGRNVFWGKLTAESYLPLASHCLDVALCFRILCELPAIQRVLRRAAARCLTSCDLDRLAVLAALHDVGKANRGFQYKPFDDKAPKAGHVRELAPLLDPHTADPGLSRSFMDALGAEDLAGWFANDEIAFSYFISTISHHGRPVRFDGQRTGITRSAREWWQADKQIDPMQGIAALMAAARRAFPGAFRTGSDPLPGAPAFHHRFAGLVMLADWLGSHTYWFPIHPVNPEARINEDRETIPRMLFAVGLDRTSIRLNPAPFDQRFPFSPRPLQKLIDGLKPDDENNRLLIAESETGSGKTEAALHWFGKLFSAGLVDSLYFALPTRVAARELYRRVLGTIKRWFPDPEHRPVCVLAVPGYAEADGLPVERCLADESNLWTDDADQRQRERRWAAEHPKRFLAATIAVGTIDQALLSVVQTAHAHLRSVCLDRALLVVDEVHASDVYVARLLEHLLCHHLYVGGRALLLSATLGSTARSRYSSVAGGVQLSLNIETATRQPYPGLTDANGILTAAGDCGQPKYVKFEVMPIALEPEQLIERLAEVLGRGARVLVMMNTVGRAIALQRAVEESPRIQPEWLFQVADVCCPHHGRFAAADRVVLDRAVSARLGQESAPGPLLLIGTQTLEQSLDIDADLLITDLVPADVLLQRVGRLHRHERQRPAGFEVPRSLVLVPGEPLVELLDDKGEVRGRYKRLGYGSVYPDLRTLALTLDAVAEWGNVEVPRDNRLLVERATHPDALGILDKADERWARHGQAITGNELMQAIQAGSVLVDFKQYFGQFSFNEMGGSVATRLGDDTWRLPLDTPAKSPFGQRLCELQIPDHLASRSDECTLRVVEHDENYLILQWGNASYRYSRFGLEKLEKEEL